MTNINYMNNPIVSFIVPSYNFAAHITECVDSILAQTISEIEVIVVNDGSTDNTKEILEIIAQKDARVRPINKENEGVSKARNTGLHAANGEYVAFVDADDYLAPDYAEYMIGLAKQSGSEFCLSLDAFTRKGEVNDVDQNETIKVISPEEATALLLSPRIIVGCWNKLFKREWLINNHLFFTTDLFYGEGLQFITTAAQNANNVCIGNKKVYYYRRNNYSSATTRFNIEKMYNGLLSLDRIKEGIVKPSSNIDVMWKLHRTLFCMGAVVRIETFGKKKEYLEDYKTWLKYIRKETPMLLLKKQIPLYRKCLLLGTCISPQLMAVLDVKRRKGIAEKSV